jgi:hypothetical protein
MAVGVLANSRGGIPGVIGSTMRDITHNIRRVRNRLVPFRLLEHDLGRLVGFEKLDEHINRVVFWDFWSQIEWYVL